MEGSEKQIARRILAGIVAYAFTLLWDNLCRNSCISFLISRTAWYLTASVTLNIELLVQTTQMICLFKLLVNLSIRESINGN